MLAKLKEIDTTAIKSLVKLNQERNKVAGFMERAESLHAQVDSTVYERVRSDYETRLVELDIKSVPLKEQAREQYRKLHDLREQIEVVFEQTRIDKEVIEFRNVLGELADQDLETKLKEAEKLLKKKKSELVKADKLKKQFVDAFDSEAELEEGLVAEEPAPEIDVGTTVTGIPAPVVDSSDMDRRNSAGTAVSDNATFIVPAASLVTLDDRGGDAEAFPLGVFNYIGRTDENQVRLALEGVSRKHALITASPDGFVLKDLESHNGTYVNDELVTERALSDGDFIGIGKVRCQFRLG